MTSAAKPFLPQRSFKHRSRTKALSLLIPSTDCRPDFHGCYPVKKWNSTLQCWKKLQDNEVGWPSLHNITQCSVINEEGHPSLGYCDDTAELLATLTVLGWMQCFYVLLETIEHVAKLPMARATPLPWLCSLHVWLLGFFASYNLLICEVFCFGYFFFCFEFEQRRKWMWSYEAGLHICSSKRTVNVERNSGQPSYFNYTVYDDISLFLILQSLEAKDMYSGPLGPGRQQENQLTFFRAVDQERLISKIQETLSSISVQSKLLLHSSNFPPSQVEDPNSCENFLLILNFRVWVQALRCTHRLIQLRTRGLGLAFAEEDIFPQHLATVQKVRT